jgi:hypothetical protein
MDHILGPIDAWWTRHPHGAELILFLIGALISLFAGATRRVLYLPLSYSAVGILRITQKRAARELQVMKFIGDSPFMLVAYYLLHTLFWALGTSFVASLLMEFFISPKPGVAALFVSLFAGGMIARLMRFYGLLGNLLNREKAVRQLEDIVAGRPISKFK